MNRIGELAKLGKMRLIDISRIDDSKYCHVMRPLLFKNPLKNAIILGFDSEWNPKTGTLLSVQFATENFAKVYYTNKLNANILLKHVLKFLQDSGIDIPLKVKKVRIYLISHFAQAEISMIADYLSDFKIRVFNKAMSAQMIFSDSDSDNEYEMYQKGNFQKGKFFLKILDLFGYFSQSLASIGELVGLPKLEIDRTKIHLVLKHDCKRFEAYAKRDAEICVKAFCMLRQMFLDRFGIDILYYPTIAGLAAAVFRTRFFERTHCSVSDCW